MGKVISALSSAPAQPASPPFLVVLCRVHLPCIWCSFPDLQEEDVLSSAALVHELLHEHDGTRRNHVVWIGGVVCNVRRREPLMLPSGSLWVLVFGVRCSVFGVRCSVFGVRCSVFGVRCSVFGWVGRVGLCCVGFVVCWLVVGCVLCCVLCKRSI